MKRRLDGPSLHVLREVQPPRTAPAVSRLHVKRFLRRQRSPASPRLRAPSVQVVCSLVDAVAEVVWRRLAIETKREALVMRDVAGDGAQERPPRKNEVVTAPAR